jgi:hypothetical protein
MSLSVYRTKDEEGLMFLEDPKKDLVASLCSECAEEQKRECLHSKEPCKKLDKS